MAHEQYKRTHHYCTCYPLAGMLCVWGDMATHVTPCRGTRDRQTDSTPLVGHNVLTHIILCGRMQALEGDTIEALCIFLELEDRMERFAFVFFVSRGICCYQEGFV